MSAQLERCNFKKRNHALFNFLTRIRAYKAPIILPEDVKRQKLSTQRLSL